MPARGKSSCQMTDSHVHPGHLLDNDTNQEVAIHNHSWSSGADEQIFSVRCISQGDGQSHLLDWSTPWGPSTSRGQTSLDRDHNPLHGVRVGEASNPGPRAVTNYTMHVTVINVTKLRKHKEAVISLWKDRPGILRLTETSADKHTETIITKQICKEQGAFYAGKLCNRTQDLTNPGESARTFFGGVATVTVPQSRACFEMVNTKEWHSTRYVEVVSRMNHLHVLTITLYLHPSTQDWMLYKTGQ